MESDRIASLLVSLATEGVIDFSKTRLFDRKWDARLLLISKQYRALKNAEMAKLYLHRFIAALSTSSSELFGKAWENSTAAIELFEELTLPWKEKNIESDSRPNNLSLIEQYKEGMKRMEDPKFKAAVEEILKQAYSRGN